MADWILLWTHHLMSWMVLSAVAVATAGVVAVFVVETRVVAVVVAV